MEDSKPGSGYCEQCSSGKYHNETSNTCELCPKNTFTISGASNFTGCERCPNGGHSQPGSGYCEHCSSGLYHNEASNECDECPAWTYTDTGGVGIEACLSCKDGFFSADPGSSTCYTCEPGKYTNADQTGCLLCPTGQISGVAASSCSDCEIGKYAEGKGNAWCKFCDDDEALIGSVTVRKGTTSSSGCICPAGDYVNQGDGENFCKNVPEGVKMNVEAMTVVNLNVSRSFWRTDNSSYDVLQCLAPEHCIGGSDPERQCKEGHIGPLCAVCVDGYASTESGMFLKCSSCTDGDPVTTITIWIFAFIFIIFLMIGISLFCFSKIKDRESLVSNSSAFHSKVDKFLEFYVQARPYAKIMLSHWQVVGALAFNFDLGFPPLFSIFMTFISAIVNLEFLNMLPLGCIMNTNYHDTLLSYTLIPFLIGLCMIIAYRILKSKGNIGASNTIFGWFLFMTFLILPSVSTKILYTFACRDFDGTYGSFLKVDCSIYCASDEHLMYELYAKVCILIYPLMYIWLLRRARKCLDPGQKHMEGRYGIDEGMRRAIEERERREEDDPQIRSFAFLYDR